MMKRLFFAAFALLCAACVRHTIIPDDELAMIFRDAFLTNAYAGEKGLRTDSLNVYEPIFARYGYTTADVQYTIGNFSKRKSARLGDVVEQAIAKLEEEGTYYNREVAILDTIDNVARRALTRSLVSDTLIRVRTLRDTSRLRFTFDTHPGEYNVNLKYLVDSLDKNGYELKGTVWLERGDKTRTADYTIALRRDREEIFSRRVIADTSVRRLHVDFVTFGGKPKQPSVTVRDLKIDYTPPTAQAVDSLYLRQLDIRIFADEFFRTANPKDSL